MRTPTFWQGPNLLSDVLMPFGDLYAAGGWLRQRLSRPRRIAVPVICVGNLVSGGAGKTPTVLAVLTQLLARGRRPAALLRGYRGRLHGPLQVDCDRHDAEAVGDEALLLARKATTWVARDRAAGAEAAAAEGADVIVMDDGFQNPTLAKDLSLLVVDGTVGFGNGRVIPAGPLREPVTRGLARADAVVLVGPDRQDIARRTAGKPLLQAEFRARGSTDLQGRRLIAFAGIGRPTKFFETLQDLQAELIGMAEFPDHHPYRESDLAPLLAKAERSGASLITTEKDAVRLPQAIASLVEVLPVDLVFPRPAALDRLLDSLLQQAETPARV